MGFLKGLGGIVLLFGVINLMLWGGQSLYYRKDTQRIKELDAQLTKEKASLGEVKDRIVQQERMLDGMLNQLEQYKRVQNISRYNSSVNEYNRLVDIYRMEVASHNAQVVVFNQKIDDVNALIQRAGTRWYLIPIPLGGVSGKARPPIK